MNHANIDDVFLYRLYLATKLLGEMFRDRVVESDVRPEYYNDVVRQQSCFELRRTRSLDLYSYDNVMVVKSPVTM